MRADVEVAGEGWKAGIDTGDGYRKGSPLSGRRVLESVLGYLQDGWAWRVVAQYAIGEKLTALIDRRWPGLSFTKNFSLIEVKPEFKELCFSTVWSNHESTSQAFGGMLIEMKVTGLYNATAGSLDMANVMIAIKTRF